MGTERPRVQGYLDPEVYDFFLKWKDLRRLKESAALNQILKEHFGLSDSQPLLSVPQTPSVEDLKFLIQEEVWGEGKSDFIEGLRIEAKNLISKEVTEAKEYWRSVDSREQIHQQQIEIVKLQERIETLEKICQPIEGLAELSQPLKDNIDGVKENEAEATELQASEEIAEQKEEYSELPSDSPIELSLSQLARHLGVAKSVVSRRKSKPDFKEWSKTKDPQGRFWRYDSARQIFGIAL